MWWHRFIGHPWLLTARALWVVVPVAALAAAVWLAVRARRARTGRQAQRAAVWVQVQPPPGATRPEDSERFWLAMAELLSQPRRGWVPHLAFELAWRRQHLTIGLWVPGWVAFTRVQEIAAAEWPGAVTYWRDGHPLGSPPVLPDGHAVAGGELAVSGGRDWLPMRAGHQADPLRGVFAQGLAFGERDIAVVHVLARPAGGARVPRAHASAAGRPGARPAGGAVASLVARLLLGLLDALTFVISTGSGSRQPSGAAGHTRADPLEETYRRAAWRKLASPPLWEVAVRYAVATPGTDDKAAGARVRGHADALAAAFGAFSGEMRLCGRRLRHPARVIATRPLRRGLLATTGELAALAHLPWEPGGVAGLSASGARPVPPPPGVARIGYPPQIGLGGDE